MSFYMPPVYADANEVVEEAHERHFAEVRERDTRRALAAAVRRFGAQLEAHAADGWTLSVRTDPSKGFRVELGPFWAHAPTLEAAVLALLAEVSR